MANQRIVDMGIHCHVTPIEEVETITFPVREKRHLPTKLVQITGENGLDEGQRGGGVQVNTGHIREAVKETLSEISLVGNWQVEMFVEKMETAPREYPLRPAIADRGPSAQHPRRTPTCD